MRIKVAGKYWDFRFVTNLGKNVGWVNYTTHQIRIKKGQSEHEELDTVIHELLHAAHEHHNEEVTEGTARDLADTLWKLGWRKTSR